MGTEMVDRNQFAEAEIYFRKALVSEPYHLTSRISLARALHDQGKFVEAIGVYETIDDAGQWSQLVEENRIETNQKAIEQYEQWIVNNPENAQLYYSLGTVYSRSNHINGGIEQYKQAIAINPVYKNALFNLASSYEAIGESGWAVTYYERMLAIEGEIDEMDQHAYKRLVEIYKQQGDTWKVKEYFKTLNPR